MEPANWEMVKNLFDAVLDLPPEDRTEFLTENCPDEIIRTEVRSLLDNHDSAKSFLSAESFLSSEQEISSADTAGRAQGVIAHYRLVQKVGEGGMGEVWLAEQRAPVRRQVALKLIKWGLNTREAMARFDSERQALALMDHPAIARVFDAGATAEGSPYFAMEYVAGIPITDYCDEHRLNTRERLELFTHVCEGVQHAHQKGIIHRDLKPSNILVKEIDGMPMPKIIDFGVAKALTQRLTEATMFTRAGTLVGTPEYMSPEQARSSGEDIDTRSDVYSLGIIFYELLAGSRPLELHTVGLEEFLRKLREEDLPKPSTKVSTHDASASTDVAHKRRTEPQVLARQLRGELDSIALKALEKERRHRYASASEFAADIRRYLNHEAVLAVPPSLTYRVRKFSQRYRTALATGVAFATVLIVATVVSVRQSIRANRAAVVAQREAAIAEAVNDFLQKDLLAQAGASAQSGPNTKPDPDLKVRTALDRAADRIEGKFAKQPESEASIRGTIGEAYLDLGLYPAARTQLQRSLELRESVLGEEDPRTLKTMTSLGQVAGLQARYSEAEALESRALGIAQRVLGPDNLDTLSIMSRLAGAYLDEEKYLQAEALDTQVLDIRKRVLGPEHPETLESINNLGVDCRHAGEYAKAEALFTQSLEIRKRILGLEHPDTLLSMSDLAVVYDDEGKYALAEALDAQTLEIRKRVLGSDHPDTLASMNNLAADYDDAGKYAQAEALFSAALKIKMRVLGPDHPDTVTTLYNLGCVAARRGDKDKAIIFLSQSVDHGLFPDGDDVMQNDPALASLHGDPRFQALIVKAKQVVHDKK